MLSRSATGFCRSVIGQLGVVRSSATVTLPGVDHELEQQSSSGCPFHALWATKKRSAPCPAQRPATEFESERSFEEMPSPRALPVLGTSLAVMKFGGAPRIHEYCDSRHKQLGPVYRENLGAVQAVFVADSALIQKVYAHEGKYPQHMVPEAWTIYNQKNDIKRGLFFMDGKEWQDRRRALNNVFLRPKTVSDHVPVFNEVISDLLANWRHTSSLNNGCLDDLERHLYNWSIESLGAMIFGRRLGCVSTTNDSADIHEFVHCVQQIFSESAKMAMVSPKLASALRLPMWRRFEKAAGRALDLGREYVEENVNQLCSRGKGAAPTPEETKSASLIAQLLQHSNIDREELVRIVIDLFLAAADTTSHATQWAFYLLSRHPESQQKILNEVNEAVGANQHITEDCLPNMPYVKAVIKEALRLYPVAPFLTRILDQEISLNGYRVPAGKLILMSLYTTGRDPKSFPEPNSFKPERWLRENRSESKVDSWACLPFGLGSRSCIGRRIAEVQMQFLLARTVKQFDIGLATEGEVPIKMRLITTPENPISLKLTPRD
ncbi:cytochrome P450 315a1, mitochondrial [Galendromus occidentalis]|uniref:Cytochrome P450 315a1, mitochondrial n=1 Tax=Galendromus occidentalis TaxID=34638 RepID=A0AAJ6QTG2_9ACAR|nr:cytochrome P450 315a1, mitochondrial [Galendromus occidentalis]